MMRVRTYQCLDLDEPEARRYLAVVSASGIGMNFPAPTALDAQAKAKDWIERERTRNQAQVKGRQSRRAKP